MIATYYMRERPEDRHRRERGLGAGTIQQTEGEWSQLIAMLELAQRWQELIGEITGEDAHPDGASAGAAPRNRTTSRAVHRPRSGPSSTT